MRSALLLCGLAATFATALVLAPTPAMAAHAGAPYANVDKKLDAGNDTGDSQVDALNAAQLNQNYAPGTNERMMDGGATPSRTDTMMPPRRP